MYCDQCGAELKSNANFCSKCGMKVIRDKVHPDKDVSNMVVINKTMHDMKKKNHIPLFISLIGGSCILIIVLMVIGISILHSKTSINNESAEKNVYESVQNIMPDNKGNVVAAGKMEDLSWTLNSEGTLYIEGEGYIPEKAIETYCEGYEEQIIAVHICNGISGVAEMAFWHQEKIREVVFPQQGFSYIGRNGFAHCTSLDNVVFPDGLKIVDTDAFFGCSSLTQITLPSTPVEDFFACFYGTNIHEVTVPGGMGKVTGDLFDGMPLEKVILEEGITEIENFAFASLYSESSLIEITIPKTLTVIGADAFSFCENIQTIYIQNGCTINIADCISTEGVEIIYFD